MFIRHLRVSRFRRFQSLEWKPTVGINCLIGPGDSGKSTLLAAIEMLLSARPFYVLSEYDFFERKVADGFEIAAVLGGVDDEVVRFASTFRVPPLWGWKDGKPRGAPDDGAEPALVLRVRGTPDLEVTHVIVAPDGEEIPISSARRRNLGFVHLGGADRGQSDLRLGRGTLLGQHLDGGSLRAGLVEALARASDGIAVPNDVRDALTKLGTRFDAAGLPEKVGLGLLTPRGESLVGLLGLVAGASAATSIPLALHGLGTRQLASFELAHGLVDATPIVVIDEPELGLEPYRQCHLMERVRSLVEHKGQAFVSTHSPAVLGTLVPSEVSRIRSASQLVRLDAADDIADILRMQPQAFLSRIPVLCEGATEAGLLDVLLLAHAKSLSQNPSALGVYVVERTGQPSVLRESRAMSAAGIEHGLFVDAENTHSGSRDAAGAEPACTMVTWQGVRNIEEIVAQHLAAEHFGALVAAGSRSTERSEDALCQQIADKAGKPGRHSPSDLIKHVGEDKVRGALADAMQAKSGGSWFKSRDGGRVLGEFLLGVGLPAPVLALVSELWAGLAARLGQ